MLELVLTQAVQEVGLVLVLVVGSMERGAAGVVFHPTGVVARRHGVALVQVTRPAEERAELHVRVAVDARARRPAVEIGVEERLQDPGVELALEVHDVERDPELRGDAPGIVGRIQRTAALLELRVGVRDVVQAHPHADDVVALLMEDRRRDRRSTPPDIATRIRLMRAHPGPADRRPRPRPRRASRRRRAGRPRRRWRSPPRWSSGPTRGGARRAPPPRGSPSRSGRG